MKFVDAFVVFPLLKNDKGARVQALLLCRSVRLVFHSQPFIVNFLFWLLQRIRDFVRQALVIMVLQIALFDWRMELLFDEVCFHTVLPVATKLVHSNALQDLFFWTTIIVFLLPFPIVYFLWFLLRHRTNLLVWLSQVKSFFRSSRRHSRIWWLCCGSA